MLQRRGRRGGGLTGAARLPAVACLPEHGRGGSPVVDGRGSSTGARVAAGRGPDRARGGLTAAEEGPAGPRPSGAAGEGHVAAWELPDLDLTAPGRPDLGFRGL